MCNIVSFIFEGNMKLLDTINGEDVCLVDSATSHTFFRSTKYFEHISMIKTGVITISGSSNIIEGSGKANIVLPNGTKLCIDEAMYSSQSIRNLLSFKDIRRNNYHVETTNDGKEKCLYITSYISGKKIVLEKLATLSSGLYYTTIRSIESYVVEHQKCPNQKHQKCSDFDLFMLWHDRLGHPGSIMMR